MLDMGIRTLAVVFMHSYTYAKNEEAVGELARSMGFEHVSLSSVVMPMAKVGVRLDFCWVGEFMVRLQLIAGSAGTPDSSLPHTIVESAPR